MHVAFTPALRETIHVVAPTSSSRATAAVEFRATLSVADYDKLKQSGGRIQLWSHIPYDGAASPAGDWAPCDFEETTVVTTKTGLGAETPTTEVILGDDFEDDVEWPGKISLVLRLAVPLPASGPAQYTFTYRILYPNGKIQWLGTSTTNGRLVVDGGDKAPVLGSSAGWAPVHDGYAWNGADEDSAVFKLPSPAEYGVWTLGGDSAQKSHIHFLIPRLRHDSVYIPPTYLLCGSSDVNVTVSSDGILSATGASSLFLFCVTGAESLTPNILAHCSEHLQVAPFGEDAEHLLVASKNTYPTQCIIIPTTTRRTKQLPSVPFDTLFALLSTPQNALAVFCPRTHNVHFIADGAVTFSGSGSFILSPVFELQNGSHKLAVLSPYASAYVQSSSSSHDNGNLPTPPPSPEFPHSVPDAVYNIQSPGSLTGSAIALRGGGGAPVETQGPMTLAERDAQVAPEAETETEQNASDDDEDGAAGQGSMTSDLQEVDAEPEQLGEEDRVAAGPLVRRAGGLGFGWHALVVQLWHMFSVALFALSIFYRLFFGELPLYPSKAQEEQVREPKQEERSLLFEEGGGNDGVDIDIDSDGAATLNEEPVKGADSDEDREGSDCSPSEAPTEARAAASEKAPSRAVEEASGSLAALVVVVGGGTVLVAVRAAASAVGPVVVEMAKKRLDAKVTQLDGGVSLLEFGSGEGGEQVVRIYSGSTAA
ncbi:hypothetical protein H0H81_005544 [Sphagnurus paluster]|uniref:Uncharacterized protein n=1 Tax=Sphagnurus paluster TaxID=117069 RepID=A0A9P7GKH3_9AGAR|nr:hypothetical protein H0H81_005544 [Sphagnurus paluster]